LGFSRRPGILAVDQRRLRPAILRNEVVMNARNLRGRLVLLGTMLIMAAGFAGTALADTPEFDAVLQRAAVENKPVILDFGTDW